MITRQSVGQAQPEAPALTDVVGAGVKRLASEVLVLVVVTGDGGSPPSRMSWSPIESMLALVRPFDSMMVSASTE